MSKISRLENIATFEIFVDMKSDSTIIVEHFPSYSLYSIQDDYFIEEYITNTKEFEKLKIKNRWIKYDL